MLKARRILLAGIAGLLPLSGAALADAPVHPPAAFAPPTGPLTLTRTVWRGLHDGQAITVARSYAVTIRPDGDGYLVDGTLIAATVDAPPQVAALAELERRRAETGLFPIRLDRRGLIQPSPPAAKPAATHPELARTAAAMISGAAVPDATRRQAGAVLDELVDAARSGTAWPADLFNPAVPRREQQRDVALPGGAKGSVAVVIEVDRAGPGLLPRSVERTVTTSLGGTASVTREQWTMQPR